MVLILRNPQRVSVAGVSKDGRVLRHRLGPWFETRRYATLLTMRFRDIGYCDPSSPSFLTSAPHFSCSDLR